MLTTLARWVESQETELDSERVQRRELEEQLQKLEAKYRLMWTENVFWCPSKSNEPVNRSIGTGLSVR